MTWSRQMHFLKQDERLDHLLGESLKIIQSPSVFSFSLDAVLLANFTYLPLHSGNIVDLCAGNGAIPLFLSKRTKANIIGVEIQERLFDMAARSIAYNQLTSQIRMIHADLNQACTLLGFEKYEVVTCNPPYFSNLPASEKNMNEHFTIARHEVKCTLEDVIRVSSQLLKQGGKLSLVHRPARLIELLLLMRQHRLEPKRLQFVYPKANKDANMILIDAIKDGKPGLKTLQPLIVYQDNNTYTIEMDKIINGNG